MKKITYNKRKRNETKRNQRNENEIENGRKNNRNQTYFHNYDARPLPTHVCLSSGEDRICNAIPTSRNLNEEFLDPEFPNLKRPDPGVPEKRSYPTSFSWGEGGCKFMSPIPPNNFMELNECYRKSLIPYGKVH
jgi:hypothetical protein